MVQQAAAMVVALAAAQPYLGASLLHRGAEILQMAAALEVQFHVLDSLCKVVSKVRPISAVQS